jgi:hypothetical protein
MDEVSIRKKAKAKAKEEEVTIVAVVAGSQWESGKILLSAYFEFFFRFYLVFRISNLFRISDFGFRISDFGFKSLDT